MNAPARFVGNRYTKITWQPKKHHDITMEAFHSPCIHATLLDHTGAAFARKQNFEEYEKAGREGLAARLLTSTESAPAFPQAPRSQPRERPNSIVSRRAQTQLPRPLPFVIRPAPSLFSAAEPDRMRCVNIAQCQIVACAPANCS